MEVSSSGCEDKVTAVKATRMIVPVLRPAKMKMMRIFFILHDLFLQVFSEKNNRS